MSSSSNSESERQPPRREYRERFYDGFVPVVHPVRTHHVVGDQFKGLVLHSVTSNDQFLQLLPPRRGMYESAVEVKRWSSRNARIVGT